MSRPVRSPADTPRQRLDGSHGSQRVETGPHRRHGPSHDHKSTAGTEAGRWWGADLVRCRSIAVVIGLVGTLFGDTDVVGLLVGELGEANAELVEMETSHLFV